MNSENQNQQKNKQHYDKLYASYRIENTLFWLNNLEAFLESATSTQASWHAIYFDDFKNRLEGVKVLEMGCGDCVNAAVMAALGAEVYANDIADTSGEIIKQLNENYAFKHPIEFVPGDFLENELEADTFDFVIGKAFLHHLTIPLETLFIKETARLLKPDGEARFFEPAVNNKLLDTLRWYTPVKGRPSKFNKEAFKEWKKNDPHPDRTFSSKHFSDAGKQLFNQVRILPVGTLERFNKLIQKKDLNNKFRKWALKKERSLPDTLNNSFARSQLIIYRSPYKK